MKIKILIITDKSFATENLVSSVDGDDTFELLTPVSTRKALVNSLQQETPDILILDINIPLIDGIDTLLAVAVKYPTVKTIVTSDYNSPRLIAELKKLGAKGYILKNIPYNDFKNILLEIHEGLDWGQYLIGEPDQIKPYYLSDEFRPYQLTIREVEVIQLIDKQFTCQEISDFLFLSEFAIQTIKENLYVKLGIQNENQLISFAKENKIIE